MMGCHLSYHCPAIVRAFRCKRRRFIKCRLHKVFSKRYKIAAALSASIPQPAACSLFISILLLPCSFAIAQSNNVGKIISYKIIPGGIEGKTENALFSIHAYNDHIIRVRFTKEKKFRNFSYALSSNEIPVYDSVKIEENNSNIVLSTKAIIAVIEKSPCFRIIFKNKNNEIINEDVDGKSFGTSFIENKPVVYKKIQDSERYVGLGEALGNLDRRGSGITLNNTDTYKYGDPRLPMYSSIPFYIGIHHQLVYGLFFNNSYQSFFNFGLSTPYTSVSFDGGDMDYFFIYDTSVSKIIEHYTSLTGRMQLPPLWALGYHQSRADYYQDKALLVAKTLRAKKIPVDCIVLDAEYQLGYEPFRIDSSRFPDMKTLADELAKMNIELTASVYPGVHIDATYTSYNDGLKKNIFLKYNDGSLFKTEIAPLKVVLPDYTNPKTRQWWKDAMKWFASNHIHGYWNDMNEPAVGGSYLPGNVSFYFDGYKTTAAEAKNVYGFQMARSSYESCLQNENNLRPFVLTRSGFAGVQRYAAMWSGDNTASDDGLLTSVLINNNMGLSGVPFIGYDIGGFIGNDSKELFTRFTEAGIFSPFCRNHKEMYAVNNEPYSYGSEVEAIAKKFIEFRYRLLPYIYPAFYQSTQTGVPVAKSLCIDYPFDKKIYNTLYQYEFLFGNDILVIPATSARARQQYYLPEGEWYDLYSDKIITGPQEMADSIPLEKIPLFVKASAIIPVQSIVQSTKDLPSDTLQIHIYKGNQNNIFTYYEDSGNSFQYRRGAYCKRLFTYLPEKKEIIISSQQGSFISKFKKLQLIFHGFGDDMKSIQLNEVSEVSLTSYKNFLLKGSDTDTIPAVKSILIDFNTKEIKISW